MITNIDQRIAHWRLVIEMVKSLNTPNAVLMDANQIAIIIQTAISELGPVPDILGEEVRNLLK